ncbi:MAG TPA: GAF domain-containing protein [Thermomicrobiales bacterium]|nr:GAF domain-containing protein [Thermomicrobiales bacterium]
MQRMDDAPATAPPAAAPAAAGERAYYSIAQAAALLGVSRVTVWRWIRAGRLPSARLGRRTTRIRREDLERLAAAGAGDGAHEWAVRGDGHGDGDGAAPHADWRAVGEANHFVQVYEADAFLLDAVADFIGASLRAGDVGVVLATAEHRAGLEERLAAYGLDPAAARAAGRYVALDAADLLARIMDGDMPEPARFAEIVGGVIARAGAGGRRVRAFGELVALLAAGGNTVAAVRLEALWNDLQRTHDFALFCAYPLASLDGSARAAALGAVCAAHDHIIPAESYAALPTPDDRLRAIAVLQQQAHSLAGEVARRQAAEASLTGQKRVLEMIATGAPLADVLAALIRVIEAQADGLLCSVLVRDPARERFCLGVAPSLPESYIGVLATAPISPPYLGPCGRAAHLGEEVVTADVATDSRWAGEWRRLALGHGLRTCYSAPIFAPDGTVLGSFGMYSREPRDPKPPDPTLIETATHLAGIAIARRRDEAALREESATLETIERIGRLLNAELDLEALVQAVTDAVTALSGAQFGAFFYNVVDERGEAYQLYTLSGARREDFARFPHPRNTAIFGPTFRGEGVVRLDDVTRDPRYGQNPPYHGMPPGHLPVRSYLAVPVIARSGDVLGGLFLAHPRPGVFTARAERLVVGLAAQAAIAMDNARLYQQAQRALQARDEFLAAVSHDLKSPLSTIKGYAQLLRLRARREEAGGAASAVADGAAKIEATADKMTALINELLDVARLEAGESLSLEREPTDLVALAAEAIAAHLATGAYRQIDLLAPDTPLTGSWDRARLARVVDNLLGNALKYSPDGGPVTASVREERDDAGAWAVLAVRDEGVGIPAAELPRVFERYRRASNVDGRIAGTGVGLATARHIVESHGGTLTAESQEGQGSTFTVRLPLTSDE